MRAELRRLPAIRLVLATLLALAPVAAQAQIAFRAATSNASNSGSNNVTLSLNLPAGTVANDVLIAALAWRACSNSNGAACTRTLAAPSGWTQIGSTIDQRNGGGTGGYGMRMALFYRVAGASEPSSFNWTTSGSFASTGISGGIASFSGVDTASPIVAAAGNATNNGNTHAASSINTGTVANTMLVATFAALSSGSWSRPSGMTEMVDQASRGTPDDLGISLEMNRQALAAAGSTGTRTATMSNPPAGDTGAAHLLALRPRSSVMSFALEAVGGGSVGTQTRGEPFAVRIRALDAGGATDTGFTGTVVISSSCTLSGGSGSSASFVAGVLASHTVTIANTGTCTLTATQGGGSATGTSNSFLVVAPSRFNAFDTSTAAGSISGPIRTKVAGSGFSLAVVAIDTAGSAVLTTFTGTVTVELLNASNNAGALNATTNCRSSWTSIQAVTPSPVFATADAGRITVAFNESDAWREVRVRITHSNAAGTTVGCSTDNFAIRPDAFTVPVASDATDATAGTTRTLNNGNATSGTVHRAGRPFTALAQAVSATGSLTSGYSGATPVLTVTGCVQPAGCTAGTLTSTLAGSSGAVSGTASYSEAGVISAALEDLTFAAVDAGDSSVAERAIRSSASATIGRFVADRYALALSAAAVMAPGACAAGGSQSFTFIGQNFSFATPPVLTITPLNAAGTVLANARPRIDAAHLASALSASGAPAALGGTPAIASIANAALSTVTYGASSFSFTRAAPVNSFNAALLFDASVSDTSEPGASAPITGSLSPSAGPLAFSTGAGTFHYGRLQLRSTYGEQTRELFVPLEVQRFNGSGWVGLPEAGACIAAAPAAFAYSNASGALAAGGSTPNCATRVASTVTTVNGRALVRLAAPAANGSTLPAAMTVTLNLLAAPAGQTCSGGTLAAAGTLAMPWLAGPDAAGNYTASPAARVSWGRTRGDYLDVRERFD